MSHCGSPYDLPSGQAWHHPVALETGGVPETASAKGLSSVSVLKAPVTNCEQATFPGCTLMASAVEMG